MLSVRALWPKLFRDWAHGRVNTRQVRWFGGIFVDVRQLLRLSVRSVAMTCVHGPFHLITSLRPFDSDSFIAISHSWSEGGQNNFRIVSVACTVLRRSPCQNRRFTIEQQNRTASSEPRALRFVSGSNSFRASPSRCPLLFHVSHSIFTPRSNDRPLVFHDATAHETSSVLIAPQSLPKSLKYSHECSGRTGNIQPCSTRSCLLFRLASYILIHHSRSYLPTCLPLRHHLSAAATQHDGVILLIPTSQHSQRRAVSLSPTSRTLVTPEHNAVLNGCGGLTQKTKPALDRVPCLTSTS